MRKTLAFLAFLIAGFLLLAAFAPLPDDRFHRAAAPAVRAIEVEFPQTDTLRPLPVAAKGLPKTVTATRTYQADLQQAGYTVTDSGGDLRIADGRVRLYTLEDSSGSSAILVDKEYPAYAVGRRELVFAVEVTGGGSPADMAAVTPELVAAAQTAFGQNSAVVAGLGYLATAAESGVEPEALQTAVIDYVQRYRHEECAACRSQDGSGDEYYGRPYMHSTLGGPGAGWTIAGIPHDLNGNRLLTLEITATVRRVSS